MDNNKPSTEQQLIRRLLESHRTVATAESCTGGLIAKRLTDIPGSSGVFPGGAVTYTNEMKMRLLNVSEQSIAEHTEVSAAVAAEMAKGARALFGTTYGVSTTGYAGPGGGTPDEPVGTVYIGMSSEAGEQVVRISCPSSDTRDAVRNAAADKALQMLLSMLE